MYTAHGTGISTEPLILECIGNSLVFCIIHWNNFRKDNDSIYTSDCSELILKFINYHFPGSNHVNMYVLHPKGVGVVHSLVVGAHTAYVESYAFDKRNIS